MVFEFARRGLSNICTTVCPLVRGDNPQDKVVVSGLFSIQAEKPLYNYFRIDITQYEIFPAYFYDFWQQ